MKKYELEFTNKNKKINRPIKLWGIWMFNLDAREEQGF